MHTNGLDLLLSGDAVLKVDCESVIVSHEKRSVPIHASRMIP